MNLFNIPNNLSDYRHRFLSNDMFGYATTARCAFSRRNSFVGQRRYPMTMLVSPEGYPFGTIWHSATAATTTRRVMFARSSYITRRRIIMPLSHSSCIPSDRAVTIITTFCWIISVPSASPKWFSTAVFARRAPKFYFSTSIRYYNIDISYGKALSCTFTQTCRIPIFECWLGGNIVKINFFFKFSYNILYTWTFRIDPIVAVIVFMQCETVQFMYTPGQCLVPFIYR
jgi:hypothetical protein